MIVTTYDMYMEKLYEEFPDVDKKSLKAVCRHGLVMLSKFKRLRHDILLNNTRENLYYYFGDVTNVEANRYEISKRKAYKKIRLVHALSKTPYSGYYYFCLDEERYQNHLKGQPIKRVFMFKCKKEAQLFRNGTHTFQYKTDEGWWFKIIPDFDTTQAEEI